MTDSTQQDLASLVALVQELRGDVVSLRETCESQGRQLRNHTRRIEELEARLSVLRALKRME
jgi:predicted secreted protein